MYGVVSGRSTLIRVPCTISARPESGFYPEYQVGVPFRVQGVAVTSAFRH